MTSHDGFYIIQRFCSMSVGMINKKKVKTKKSYFVKYLIAIIMITSFDLMQ